MKNKKNDFKKILITGAGSGLGKEACISLASMGYDVLAGVYYDAEIDDFKKMIIKNNLKIHVLKLNILDKNNLNLISDYEFDILICNSAIGNSGCVAEIPIEKIVDVFNTNVFATLSCVQIAIRHFISNNKSGRIIILSSLVGRIPMPFLSPYCASKFALDCFGTCLRQEMKLLNSLKGFNIQVSLIEPGAYATGFNKENNEKKYEWMYDSSYFSGYVNTIRKKEKKLWNFLEQKPYDSIIKQYIKAVEDKHPKHRYSAPWWQTMFVQLGRIFGM